MITDAEFWIETRRSVGGGDGIFKSMLALIHARQQTIDSHVTTTDKEEYRLTSWGKKHRDEVSGRVFSNDERKEMELLVKQREMALNESGKVLELNKAFTTDKSAAATGEPLYGVAASTIRVLQQVMMFAVPIYALRYNVPAMSMSWNTSCFIDRQTKQLITFGAGHGVKVPQQLRGRGCVAGDGFFAILSNQDEVWASGGLKVSSASVDGPTSLGREDAMTGIAGKTLMLVGHGQRLAVVTRAFTVRPLSALSNPTRSIIPTRHVRFLDLGYGEDYYMVGTDSIVYKTTASKRAVSTPRRVMTLCRTAVSRMASGTGFLLIIDQNGHLYTFGRNKKGQLGNGEVQDGRRKPYLVEELRNHYFVQVAAGDCHSLALASNGVVYGAGSNESGQLGMGRDVKQATVFTPIPLGEGEVRCIGIAAGPAGSMFYCDNGQVFTCGLNDSMQLGLDTTEKVVCKAGPVSALADGVESYTMDFGGFRRPEELRTSPPPQSAAAAAAPPGDANVADAGNVGLSAATRAKNTSVTRSPTVIDVSTTPKQGYGDAGTGENNEINVNMPANGGPRSGINVVMENHQPVDDAVVHPAMRRGKNKGLYPKDERQKKARGKCGCCAVI